LEGVSGSIVSGSTWLKPCIRRRTNNTSIANLPLCHTLSLAISVAVIKHYEDFHEDQFDFHNYCIRKVTLRSYCKLLKFEDELWGLPHYCRAAEGVINIHLHLVDNAAKSQKDEELDYSEMTPAERKKAKNVARKKKKAMTGGGGGDGGGVKEGVSSKNNAESNGNKKRSKPHIIDEDPEGKDLLALDHLEEAMKFATILVRHAPKRMSAWALQYDVSIRRGKMLLALQVRVVLFFRFGYLVSPLYNINSSSRKLLGPLQNEINRI
jgi:hypothetical protein